MLGYIIVMLSTGFGLMFQQDYGKQWDEKLSKLLEEEWETATIEVYNRSKPETHVISFGDVTVWVGNKYYGYGHRYEHFTQVAWWENKRPSIKTMLKLDRLVAYKIQEFKDKEREEG